MVRIGEGEGIETCGPTFNQLQLTFPRFSAGIFETTCPSIITTISPSSSYHPVMQVKSDGYNLQKINT